MSFNTPQRPLPGMYFQTPAPGRSQQVGGVEYPPLDPSSASRASDAALGRQLQQIGQQIQQIRQPAGSSVNGSHASDLKARAGRAIDNVFRYELDQPDLDAYVGQGVSNQYDTSNDQAWEPFQTVKTYPIPDQIYDQFNRAQVMTGMGLFADIDHAWVAIDNALYLWDYTNPSSVNLTGVEEQSSVIIKVHLAVPREGVFLPEIKYLLVVATVTEIVLFAVSLSEGRGNTKSLLFHKTDMSVSIKGLDINVITSSRKTGRIFFAGRSDNDVYELTYHPEERWFAKRCGKKNHVTGLYSMNTIWKPHTNNYVLQMCVDDSRQLLYTLAFDSSIRVFHMKEGGVLELTITKELPSTFTDIGNRATGNIMSDTLNSTTKLISISPIPSQEAAKLHLMATTNTGYRIYFSATSRHGWVVSESSQAPRSLQVQHIKLPPRVQPPATAPLEIAPNQGGTDTNIPIKSLYLTHLADRVPPGYFFCFTHPPQQDTVDTVFISSVDSGRTARAPNASQVSGSRFYENQMWIILSGRAADIGMRTPPYTATERPAGFGNESSLQFDKATPELAILTNAGVHIVRRRRHVDVFAAFARQGSSGEEGRAALVKAYITRYGRRETIATALAVACGQGVEVLSDFRLSQMTDATVLGFARDIFVKEGGKATLNQNLVESQVNPIDVVRPSPRHFGLVLYLSRIIRAIWSSVIVKEHTTPARGSQILPCVPVVKLQEIQRNLSSLQEFLRREKGAIDGLSGPEILSRAATQLDEVAYQGEHRDMQAIVQFIDSTIEGISFVLVLFDERVEEIVALLSDESKPQFMAWNFRELFTQQKGKDLAKEVVKAIVNRNIAKGANVETIAEALRRRCGSFCSADDVIIFKAQELLKRASEPGSNAEGSRILLNDSLRLFTQVAQSLPMDYLTSAVDIYVSLQFFAGAIELALAVAQQSDRPNLALSWMNDGDASRVDTLGATLGTRITNAAERYADPRRMHFEFRKQCYDLIHRVILSLDDIANREPESFASRHSMMTRRRIEAYEVINNSQDEVFLTNLYDWYLFQGWEDRILATDTAFVETYLNRRAQDELTHADLLSQYYTQKNRFYDAANIQFGIAQSSFILKLDERIGYLSRAKANISTRTPTGNGPRSWQELKQRISDQLDLATVQADILQRLMEDSRLVDDKTETLAKVNGPILSMQELFHQYADFAGYWDICLVIFLLTDTRDQMAILHAWTGLIESTHNEAVEANSAHPYEVVIEKVRNVGNRVRMSDFVFPVQTVLPLLERYKFEHQRDIGPSTWVVDLLLELDVAHETIYSALEGMFYNNEAPFSGGNRRVIGNDLVYLIREWFLDNAHNNRHILANQAVTNAVLTTLQMLQQNGVDEEWANEARTLRARIQQMLQ